MKERDQINRFEELLRKKADSFMMKPSDDVWANVKISLLEKRRRKFLWLFAAAVALLFGTGLFGWLIYDHQQHRVEYAETPVTSPSDFSASTTSKNELTEPKRSNGEKNIEIMEATEDPAEDKSNSINSGKSIAAAGHEKVYGKNLLSKKDNQGNTSSSFSEFPYSTIQQVNTMLPLKSGKLFMKIHPESSEQRQLLTTSKFPNALRQDLKTSTEPDAGNHQHHFSLKAEVIPLVSYTTYGFKQEANTFSTATKSTMDSLTTKASDNSSPDFGYSAGIKTQYDLSDKLLAFIGIYYSKTAFRHFNSSSVAVSHLVADSNSVGFIPQSGNFFLPLSGSAGTSHMKWIDLSAGAEWLFWKHKKNQLSAEGSVGISKFLQFNFAADDNSNEVFNNSSFTNNVQPLRQIKVYNLISTTGINYHRILSDRFAISAGMQLHYYISDILTENFNASQHPYWAGTNAGIEYSF